MPRHLLHSLAWSQTTMDSHAYLPLAKIEVDPDVSRLRDIFEYGDRITLGT